MDKLKSCPFCGGTAIKGGHEVWCGECFASTNKTCTPIGDWNKRVENQERIKELEDEVKLLTKQLEVPMQPMIDGRFKSNKVVEYLLDNGGIDMNRLAVVKFAPEDKMQFAQLIGYSLGGYSDLSYTSDESYFRAEKSNKVST